MYNISDKIMIFITNAIANLTMELTTGRQILPEVKIVTAIHSSNDATQGM